MQLMIIIQFLLILLNCLLLFNRSNASFVENEVNCDKNDEKSKYFEENNIKLNLNEKWKTYFDAIDAANYQHVVNATNSEANSSECDPYLNYLESDLSEWRKSGISRDAIERTLSLKRGVHYQVINHVLYRDRECMFPSRCEGVEHFIQKIIAELPDMDLIVNVRDYPQVHVKREKLPVFSFSKDTTQYADITYPAWVFWCGGPAIDRYPSGIGRWDLMRQQIANNAIEWRHKNSTAFFRGSRTSSDRDPLIRLSREKPHLIDAKYTKNQAWRSLADTLGEEPAATVSFEEQCKYKYLFNLRGVAASFRYKHLFLCKSLVLNVESNWNEFFYDNLKPWIHYVPISSDFSDVQNILQFLIENDSIGEKIANQGFDFIWNNLTLDTIECYWKQLLLQYAKLLTYKPKINNDLIKIKQK